MADVAHEAGVSVASVSNFLNKQPYMSEAMAARIAEAIDRLGYKVNSSARNLRSGRTRLLPASFPVFYRTRQTIVYRNSIINTLYILNPLVHNTEHFVPALENTLFQYRKTLCFHIMERTVFHSETKCFFKMRKYSANLLKFK